MTELLSDIIRKEKKVLTVLLFFSFFGFWALTFLLSPQYKSTTLVFPLRQFTVSKLIIEQNVGNQEDYMLLGDEDDAEKVLEIMNSDAMKKLIFDRFDLWNRWKINKDSKDALFYMINKWKKMVRIKKTVFNVVKIEVWDYTSAGAAEISNAIAAYCDSVRFRMIQPVALHALKIIEEEYFNTLNEMNKMEDSLRKLRKMGIMDYKSQVASLAKSYAKAIEKNDMAAAERVKKAWQQLEEYGGNYHHISENLRKYRFKYPVIKAKYEEAKINARYILPSVFVFQKGMRNEHPDRPERLLISFAGMIGAGLCYLVFCLYKYKNHLI
jgi:capsule polysaccharide export protein KpsE/RkpR